MTTLTPNMSLIVPTVGNEPGPDYAFDVNASLSIIDSHDHTPGKGLPITPEAISMTSDLTFSNFSATDVASIVFTAQTSISTVQSVYVIGADLFYRDGNDNEIQLTLDGVPAGPGGSISGLPSGTAGVVYSGGTYSFYSATNTPANVRGANFSLGNNIALTKYLTLAPPNSMAADYTITLPALPSGNSYLTITSGGIIGTTALVDNSTIEFNSNVLRVKPGGIGPTQLASTALTWNTHQFTSSGTFTVPAGVNVIVVEACGGGGGGGGSGGISVGPTATTGGGAGGQGAQPKLEVINVTPGAVLTITIGTAGTAGAAGGTGTIGGTGGTGGSTTLAIPAGRTWTFAGGAGGAGSAAATVGGQAAGAARNTTSYSPLAETTYGGAGSTQGLAEAGQISNRYETASTPGNSNGGIGGAAGGGGAGGGGAGVGAGGNGGNGASGANTGMTSGTAGTLGGGGGAAGGRAAAGGGSLGLIGSAGGAGIMNIYWLGTP